MNLYARTSVKSSHPYISYVPRPKKKTSSQWRYSSEKVHFVDFRITDVSNNNEIAARLHDIKKGQRLTVSLLSFSSQKGVENLSFN